MWRVRGMWSFSWKSGPDLGLARRIYACRAETGQYDVLLAGMVIVKGLDLLCLEFSRVSETAEALPWWSVRLQLEALSVLSDIELVDRAVSSPILKKPWNDRRNIALRSTMV